MRVETISDEYIKIFINLFYIDSFDISKNELGLRIKKILDKVNLRYRLYLDGFYKVNCYINKKLGIFMDLIKIDDNEFSKGVDYRIVIYDNNKFYLECNDIDINNYKIIKYNNTFYIDIDSIDSNDIDISNIVYGKNADKIFLSGKSIK